MFLPRRTRPAENDWMLRAVKRYVTFAVDNPKPVLGLSVPLLLGLAIVAVSPTPRLPFDVSTRSMEPKKSDAGYALASIMARMPTRWEPVLGIVRAESQEELHAFWQKLEAHWARLREAGKIKDYSTPAALIMSPARIEANRQRLSTVDLNAAEKTFSSALDTEGFSRDAFASGFKLLEELRTAADPGRPLPNWREQLPKSSSWWFLIDRYFGHEPLLTTGFVTTNRPVDQANQRMLRREMPVEGVPMTMSGWSFTLADLLPWSRRQLILISALMAVFEAGLLAILYRDWRLWLIQVASLFLAVAAMIASMKLLAIPLNILNVLAFRLVLAIGVDYGIYVLLVWQKARDLEHDVAGIVKPVIMAGLTAVAGFASLGIANNPTLSGLGFACALGIFWSLATTVFFTLPAAAAAEPKLLDRKK